MSPGGKMTRKEYEKSGENRRTSPRLSPSAFSAPVAISLNSGSDVSLINISRGGILLQGTEFLRPNTKIALNISVADSIYKVLGRVLRSTVSQLKGGMQYNSAVVFDADFAELDNLTAPPKAKAESGISSPKPEPNAPSSLTGTVQAQQKSVPAPSADTKQASGDETPDYAPEQVFVVTPERVVSNPALLQALELNRW